MSHTTVEPETGAAEPIGYLDGRPVYEEGGRLVAGPNGDQPASGATGAPGDGSTQTGQSSTGTGQGTGGTAAEGAPTGSAEGSAQASSVDDSSQDTGSGQQASGSDVSKLTKALAAERQQRKQAQTDLAALRREHATAEERQLMEAKEQASKDAEGRVKPPLIKALAAAQLQAAGVQGPTTRLVGLLDMDKIEIDDDGEVSGLTAQVEALKTEFPNLFTVPSTGRTPAPNANGGSGARTGRQGDNGAPAAPKGFAQQLADIVLTGQPGAGTAMR